MHVHRIDPQQREAVAQRDEPEGLRAQRLPRGELGLSSLVIVFGQIGGPMIAGLLADATGSYLAGFTLLAAMVGAGSLFFLLARKPRLAAAG